MIIRIWLFLMGALTAVTTAPYVLNPKGAAEAFGLALVGPEAEGRVLVAFGMQGVAMGLYCLWGAAQARQARDSLRFLTLYMACVAVGRGIAAAPFLGQPTSQPMIFFLSDTAITLICAWLLWRDGKKPALKAGTVAA